MYRRPLVFPVAALLLAACGIASAQNAYTSKPMNVRAGPDREYPLVAQLDAGAPLDVHGCLSDWSWCDVSFGDNRGWIYAGGLSFVYQGERVPLYSYGPSLGLPIVTFALGAYWDDYYRGRPWYAQRSSWAHRRMPAVCGPAADAESAARRRTTGSSRRARPRHAAAAARRPCHAVRADPADQAVRTEQAGQATRAKCARCPARTCAGAEAAALPRKPGSRRPWESAAGLGSLTERRRAGRRPER
jgi:uncharacterized protein YraI